MHEINDSGFNHARLNGDTDERILLEEPGMLAVRLMAGKNFWLARIRWLYTFFILAFFSIFNYFSGEDVIDLRNLFLIAGLSLIGNIIFIMTLKRGVILPRQTHDRELYSLLSTLQLDFDLVILSLLVFFSGGFNSPVVVMYIFYIMVATFLIQHKKAFRNTMTAIVLVVVIFFSTEGFTVSFKELTTMVAFNIILFFTFCISAYLSRNLQENEQRIHELLKKTRELSVTDGLTGLYNQSHFFLLFKLQLEKSKRYETAFSVIIFDVDHFKQYNDHNGHLRGSETLRRIGGLMGEVFRSSDILAKYGGDEFVILLPNSDKIGAFLAADRLREVVEAENFQGESHQPLGKLTLSLGIASFPEHGRTVEDILDRADKALYVAKKTGRNKTLIYNEDLEELLE